ncbi:MAG: TrbC/VirB2 family protein [Rickettsiales bacterium]|nr:TrbC/VirB2 family protein [Rickettsiales bacterium]
MNRNIINIFYTFALFALFYFTYTEHAMATSSPFAAGICQLVALFQGTTMRAIATIAVIFLGISAFFGKVNWGLAIMVAVGIVTTFAAIHLVDHVATAAGSPFLNCDGAGYL